MKNSERILGFVNNWMHAFNAHEIELILGHYTDDIEFYSPFISLLGFNKDGVVKGKDMLKRYFTAALKAYPDLHFRLHNYFTGVNTVVVYYTSVNGRMAAETFLLNEDCKAVKVYCNYTSAPSAY